MMTVQELQSEKLELINWIANLEDIDTISRLRSIQNESDEIPQWQQDLVLERIANAKPEDFIPWEEARKRLRK